MTTISVSCRFNMRIGSGAFVSRSPNGLFQVYILISGTGVQSDGEHRKDSRAQASSGTPQSKTHSSST